MDIEEIGVVALVLLAIAIVIYIVVKDSQGESAKPVYTYTHPKPGIECIHGDIGALGCYRIEGGAR